MKKNGYSLIEVLMVLVLMSIIGLGTIGSIAKVVEKCALKRLKNELPLFLDNIAYKAMQEGKEYLLKFDFENYRISCGALRYNLPKCYNYFRKKGRDGRVRKFEITVKSNGNIDDMFLIFVVDKCNKEALYRIGMYNTSVLRYLRIRRFYPKRKPILLSDSGYYEIEKWMEEK